MEVAWILPCWGHRSGSVLSAGWREHSFAPVLSAGHERVTATPEPARPPAPHPVWHGILPSQAGCFGNHASVMSRLVDAVNTGAFDAYHTDGAAHYGHPLL